MIGMKNHGKVAVAAFDAEHPGEDDVVQLAEVCADSGAQLDTYVGREVFDGDPWFVFNAVCTHPGCPV